MFPQTTTRFATGVRRLLLWSGGFVALMSAGCACFQLCPQGPCLDWCPCCPRIDPSGESLFLSPQQQQVVVPPPVVPATPLPTTPPPALPPAVVAPPPIPAPAGNVLAPPVFSDPAVGPVPPAAVPAGQPVVTVPATPMAFTAPAGTPVVAQSVAVPPPGAIPLGQDHLRITPDRILAPVGSEVVLKGGICSASGYLLKDRRVEWLLPADGPGKFVDVAERDEIDIFRWVWDTPHKHDNWYVVSATSGQPTVLDRGTPDPCDDVQVADGEAWVTVTSASEGTSRVTAYAPSIGNWQFRQASATIYWVDAQWVFPQSAVASPGRPLVLTTTVMRRTDGAPLAGWIVRYDVARGASLGYEGGKFVEVPTDAGGRASVEVSPNDVGGGAAAVGVTIIRPQQGGANPAPRLEIGRGSATISWGGAPGAPAAIPISPAPIGPAPIGPGIPGLPAPPSTTGGPSPTPITPISPSQPMPPPSLPPGTQPSDRYTPPQNQPPAGQPQLEVTLRQTSPEAVAVGDFVRFEVVVTNRGSGVARNIEVRDRFDPGLSHPSAKPNEFSVEYLGMRDLAPNESAALPSPLTFRVEAPGQHCHEVTVTADGAAPVSKRACVSTRQPALAFSVDGPRRQTVGETAKFNVVVRNTGDVAATNVEITCRFDPALEPSLAPEGHERLPDGGVLIRILRMEAMERRPFALEAVCRAANNNACCRGEVKADGGIAAADDACFEILPQQAGGGAIGAAPAAATNLPATISITRNPGRAGETADVLVTVTNTAGAPQQQVTLTVVMPDSMTVDEARIQPAGRFTRLGQQIRFQTVPQLAPGQRIEVVVPVTLSRAGQVRVGAEVSAAGMAAPVRTESTLIDVQAAAF